MTILDIFRRNKYDPTDLKPYLGKTFESESGSEYYITEEGELRGAIKYIEFGDNRRFVTFDHLPIIKLAAGIPKKFAEKNLTVLRHGPKKDLVKIIRSKGREMEEGLSLVIAFEDSFVKDFQGFKKSTDEDKGKPLYVGFVSSIIKKIK